MTLGQRIDRDNARLIKEITADITEKVTADVTEKNMYSFLEFLLEENKTKDESLAIMSKKYPQFEDKYTAFINEHGKNA